MLKLFFMFRLKFTTKVCASRRAEAAVGISVQANLDGLTSFGFVASYFGNGPGLTRRGRYLFDNQPQGLVCGFASFCFHLDLNQPITVCAGLMEDGSGSGNYTAGALSEWHIRFSSSTDRQITFLFDEFELATDDSDIVQIW